MLTTTSKPNLITVTSQFADVLAHRTEGWSSLPARRRVIPTCRWRCSRETAVMLWKGESAVGNGLASECANRHLMRISRDAGVGYCQVGRATEPAQLHRICRTRDCSARDSVCRPRIRKSRGARSKFARASPATRRTPVFDVRTIQRADGTPVVIRFVSTVMGALRR